MKNVTSKLKLQIVLYGVVIECPCNFFRNLSKEQKTSKWVKVLLFLPHFSFEKGHLCSFLIMFEFFTFCMV
jgi:hypothetical protein